jgi:phage gp29-like protein
MSKKRGKGRGAANSPQAKPPDQIIAGARNDVFAKLQQGIIKPSDATLAERGAGKGLAIYDDIERDGNAYAVLQKRKLAVVSFPWEVDAATDAPADEKAAEGIREMLDGVDVDGLSLGLLDAVLKGFAVAEVEWDPETWAPLRFHPRDQRRFLFDADGAPRLITPENRQEGIQLPERKFVIHRFGAKDGNPYGLGLGTRLFWPTLFKRKGLAFWLVFAEKFGGPTVLGKYPAHLDEAKQEALLDALTRSSQETAIIAPLETEIQLLEAARSGSVDTYEKLMRYLDEEVTKTVLGETLTTSVGDVGSFAAAQTHNGVRMELIKADADLLSATLNSTLLAWLTEFHFPGANPPRLWRRVEVPKDEKAEADKDLVIFQMGFSPSEKLIQEKYGPEWYARGGFAPGGELGTEDQPPAQGEVQDAEIVTEGAAPAQTAQSGVVVQDTALNGAQVASLLQVLGMAADGTLPKESVTQVIRAAFPGVPEPLVAGMVGPIQVKEPAAPPEPAPRAEFAEPEETGRLADIAEPAAARGFAALTGPARRLVATAGSLEEIRDGVLALYAEADPADLADALLGAVTAAYRSGKASVRA